MARKIISEDIAANEIFAKFGKVGLKKAWHRYAREHTESDGITNIEDFIVLCQPELASWLESLIPHIPSFSTIDEVIADYFRGEYYLSDLKS